MLLHEERHCVISVVQHCLAVHLFPYPSLQKRRRQNILEYTLFILTGSLVFYQGYKNTLCGFNLTLEQCSSQKGIVSLTINFFLEENYLFWHFDFECLAWEFNWAWNLKINMSWKCTWDDSCFLNNFSRRACPKTPLKDAQFW